MLPKLLKVVGLSAKKKDDPASSSKIMWFPFSLVFTGLNYYLLLCVNPVLGSSSLKVYPCKQQPSKSSTAIVKYVILLLCYSIKVCHMLWVENSCNLEKISDWISNVKGFPLFQIKPNPSNDPVLFSLYARIFYWIFCCLSLESAMWGWILSEHSLFILKQV